ncbi:MAG: c-type cytochrome [Verrucomicrobiae bacterium]|nr:c-type cytochrome [Verrucomicrobiae bacterium]
MELIRKHLAVVSLVLIGTVASFPSSGEVSDRSRLALEALLRMENKDLDGNPALRQAVHRLASQIGSEPELVGLVAAFRLEGMHSNLLAVAVRHPSAPEAGEAVRWILDGGDVRQLNVALNGDDATAMALLQAMASAGDARCAEPAFGLIEDAARSEETRRAAIRVLVSSPAGASKLLDLLVENALPDSLAKEAESALYASRLPGVRDALVALRPGKSPAGRRPLPPMGELLAMRGDATRGRELFRRSDVACSACHQVGDDGVDFGPKLTGIGSKLAREALIAAILEPSSGISFGFEAWQITRTDGEEYLGLIASESADELLLKLPGQPVVAIQKEDIASREQQTLSIMPAGLEEQLSAEEFADLIEYLASLRSESP